MNGRDLGGGEFDAEVRVVAFRWLQEKVDALGDVLPYRTLREGFDFGGERVPVVGPQGIFKPRILSELPLSITTAPDGPYDDSFTAEGLLAYRYRGTDPRHRDNVGLRSAMQRGLPLIYFHGVATGQYLAVWPVFVVGDDPTSLTFKVAADDLRMGDPSSWIAGGVQPEAHDVDARRIYITATVRVRLHQRGFRERVLAAYHNQCALCRLRHRELLDAAHITPDSEESGDPAISNGLALCKIHHAAFDRYFIGVRPDYVVEVHPRILEESDGPMLKHGLQGLHQTRLVLPPARKHRPDPDRLAARYERFRGAA